MKPLVRIRNLRVRRHGSLVLQVDELDVARGEVLGVVGPNGAGKTTLLLTLARLVGQHQGEIEMAGQPLRQWNSLEQRRRISLVFQNPMLLDMSVSDNVAIGLRLRRMPKAEVRARVNTWLRRLGIENLSRRRAGELSGGEAQRVSLARALVLHPDLLLLDEPFLALDPPARAMLMRDLAELLQHDHRTAILVTHNLKEAAKLSDRVAVIVGGKLRQVGPARQVKAHPADQEVAAFLKTMPR